MGIHVPTISSPGELKSFYKEYMYNKNTVIYKPYLFCSLRHTLALLDINITAPYCNIWHTKYNLTFMKSINHLFAYHTYMYIRMDPK